MSDPDALPPEAEQVMEVIGRDAQRRWPAAYLGTPKETPNPLFTIWQRSTAEGPPPVIGPTRAMLNFPGYAVPRRRPTSCPTLCSSLTRKKSPPPD